MVLNATGHPVYGESANEDGDWWMMLMMMNKVPEGSKVHPIWYRTARQVIHNRGGGATEADAGRVNFTRTWAEYRRGFGDFEGEFWDDAARRCWDTCLNIRHHWNDIKMYLNWLIISKCRNCPTASIWHEGSATNSYTDWRPTEIRLFYGGNWRTLMEWWFSQNTRRSGQVVDRDWLYYRVTMVVLYYLLKVAF